MSRETLLGEAVRVQRVLLHRIRDREPASDLEIAEHALLLTLRSPTADELERAFGFWDLGSAARRVNATGLVATKATAEEARKGQPGPKAKPVTPAEAARLLHRVEAHWWAAIEGYREGLRSRLLEIVPPSEVVRDRHVEMAREALQRDIDSGAEDLIFTLARRTWVDSSLRTDLFYWCDTMEGAFHLALSTILDRRNEFAEILRSCRLSECGRLFLAFAPRSGGPRPFYCRPEHQAVATKLTGAERTRLWRERQARRAK